MFYADDSQMYLDFDLEDIPSRISRLENCACNVKSWTMCNNLLLNDTKMKIVHYVIVLCEGYAINFLTYHMPV